MPRPSVDSIPVAIRHKEAKQLPLADRPHYIYHIVHRESGRSYVGIAWWPISRWNAHIQISKKSPTQYICRAIAKHGADAFDWKIVECLPNRQSACEREIQSVASGKFEFNLHAGGDRGEKHVTTGQTPEGRARISAAQKARPRGPLSKEHRQAIARGNTGNVMPPRSAETQSKITAALKQVKRTPEFKQRAREFQTGRKKNPESVAKTAAAHRGVRRSEEHKERLRWGWVKRKSRKLYSDLTVLAIDVPTPFDLWLDIW